MAPDSNGTGMTESNSELPCYLSVNAAFDFATVRVRESEFRMVIVQEILPYDRKLQILPRSPANASVEFKVPWNIASRATRVNSNCVHPSCMQVKFPIAQQVNCGTKRRPMARVRSSASSIVQVDSPRLHTQILLEISVAPGESPPVKRIPR